MEDQLKQYLKEFVETLKQGGEFAQEQLPLFVKEYLTWGFWEATILGVILLLTSILLAYTSNYLWGKAVNYETKSMFDDGDFPLYLLSAISGLSSAFLVVFAISEIMTAIKITVAPRVYLIENLMNLL